MSLFCQMNHFIKFPGLTLPAEREKRAEPGQERESIASLMAAVSQPHYGGKPSPFQQIQEIHELGISSSFRDW